MPVDNREFLDWAKKSMQGDVEIDYRNAASRAYYAAFHEADCLVKKNDSLKLEKEARGGSHKGVVRCLKNSKNQEEKEIGQILEQCKIEREKADYRLEIHFSESRARVAIGLAERVLQLVGLIKK